jgi:hypothetical protein
LFILSWLNLLPAQPVDQNLKKHKTYDSSVRLNINKNLQVYPPDDNIPYKTQSVFIRNDALVRVTPIAIHLGSYGSEKKKKDDYSAFIGWQLALRLVLQLAQVFIKMDLWPR